MQNIRIFEATRVSDGCQLQTKKSRIKIEKKQASSNFTSDLCRHLEAEADDASVALQGHLFGTR